MLSRCCARPVFCFMKPKNRSTLASSSTLTPSKHRQFLSAFACLSSCPHQKTTTFRNHLVVIFKLSPLSRETDRMFTALFGLLRINDSPRVQAFIQTDSATSLSRACFSMTVRRALSTIWISESSGCKGRGITAIMFAPLKVLASIDIAAASW